MSMAIYSTLLTPPICRIDSTNLSSLPPDLARFARAVRGHWSVENNLHWSLEVSFGEDGRRARTRHAATNLAAPRRLALNWLRPGSLFRKKPQSKTSPRRPRS